MDDSKAARSKDGFAPADAAGVDVCAQAETVIRRTTASFMA
jgi:hypothetical protein